MSTGKLITGGLALVGGIAGFMTGGIGFALVGVAMGAAAGMALNPMQSDTATPGAPQSQNLDMPTIEEGTPIYDLLGTSKVVGHIFWYGPNPAKAIKQKQSGGGKGGGGKTSKVTVGYEYSLTWAQGLILGPADEVYTIFRDDDPVWHGNLTRPVSGGVQTVTLEGMGSCTIYFGTTDQPANATIGAQEGATLNPSYRGLCYAFFDDCFIGTVNRAPIMRFVLRKTPVHSFNANHLIAPYDYNAGHGIYHVLTSNQYVGFPITWINETSFSDFCDLMADESERHGISMLISRQEQGLRLLESMLTHLDATMRYGVDGKFHLHANRSYDAVGTIPSINQSIFTEPMVLERAGWTEVVNEIQVQHHIRYDVELEGESVIWTPDDPFDGNNGDPPDTEKWAYDAVRGMTAFPAGTFTREDVATIQSNKFNYNRDVTPTGRYLSVYTSTWNFVEGTDFEIQVDIDVQSGSGGYQGEGASIYFGGWAVSGDKFALMRTVVSPWTGNAFEARTSNSFLGGTTDKFTIPLTSKFKLKYEHVHPTEVQKSRVTGWYWEPIGAQWEYDGDTAGEILVGDRLSGGALVFLEFSCRDAVNICNFNNFTVISGEIENGGEDITDTVMDIRRAQVKGFDRGVREMQGRAIPQSTQLMGFGTTDNANWAADRAIRKGAYPFAKGQLTCNREFFKYEVGDLFKLSDSEHNIVDMVSRVLQIGEGALDSEEISVSWMEEPDYVTSPTTLSDITTEGATRLDTIAALEYIAVIESPYVLSGDEVEIIPLAERVNGSEIGYELWVSVDNGTSYLFFENIDFFAVHGTLVTELSERMTTLDIYNTLTVDFTFDTDAQDIETITRTAMLAPIDNLMVVGDEIISFETITPDGVEDSRYHITNLNRGWYDTIRETHAIGVTVWFLGVNAIQRLGAANLIAGATRKFKMVPYNARFVGNISEATDVSLTLEGRGKQPYTPGNLRVNGNGRYPLYQYNSHLTWSPRVRGADAGINDADTVTDAAPIWEGFFEIEVVVSTVTVRTVTGIDALSWTYTHAMNVADNGTMADEITFTLKNYISSSGVRYDSRHTRNITVERNPDVTATTTTTTTTTTT